MRRTHFDAFRPHCPICAAAPLHLAHTLEQRDDDVIAGILHCPDTACAREFPIIDGIPVIVADASRLLRERGIEVLLRDDLPDALESLLADAIGPDSWLDAMRQVQSTYAWDSFAEFDPDEAPAMDSAKPGAAARCMRRLLEIAEPLRPARAVDLGCGAGGSTFELAARHPSSLVLGIDINLGLLRLARHAAQGLVSYARRRIGLVYDRRRFPVALDGAARVDFWACDAAALPLPPGAADITATLNLLECMASPRDFLAECTRITAPSGRVVMATPYDWSARTAEPRHWIGGHSQRAEHAGAGEPFLRTLLAEAAHPQSVSGLRLRAEIARWPWHTRLTDRSIVMYMTHLLALDRL